MDIAPEDRIHHPLFEIWTAYAHDGTGVTNPQQNNATLQIRHSHRFFGKSFGANIIFFELNTGVFSSIDQIKNVVFIHYLPRQDTRLLPARFPVNQLCGATVLSLKTYSLLDLFFNFLIEY